MSAITDRLKETTAFIQQHYSTRPQVGIVLGSGLGNLIREMIIEKEMEYHTIPYFPVSTVEGHPGKLIFGELGGKKIVCMAGRFHFYEGYAAAEVTYPIRVMKELGIETLLVSNAAGGVNAEFKVGDLMIIEDHIGFFAANPLIGKNEMNLGPRFPDMSEPYKKGLIRKAEAIAKKLGIVVKKGVYCGVTGPSFETRAEYKLIQRLGGDAVGMSTVQEVIVAVHAGLQVFAMSVITDIGIREEENVITHSEVLQAARDAEPKLSAIFREMIVAL
jgi:purine-nucleoside phosphorylase